jgi:hypothetical protein
MSQSQSSEIIKNTVSATLSIPIRPAASHATDFDVPLYNL